MTSFTPGRLKHARVRRGYSRATLATMSGVSARTITAYENETAGKVTTETLSKLAHALQVPKSYLSASDIDPVDPSTVSFRKLAKTSKRAQGEALAHADLVVELFSHLEERFNLPKNRVPNLSDHTPEDAAILLRQELRIGDHPIPNMLSILESIGVRVAALPDTCVDIDAFCFFRDASPYVLLNTHKTAERQRFDAAHELGHLVLHNGLDQTPQQLRDQGRDIESEAHAFAAEFLMPRSAIKSQSMAHASEQRILAARSHWGVSAMALTHRLHKLKLITDWEYRNHTINLTQKGYRTGEPDGRVPDTSKLLRQIFYKATKRIKPSEAAALIHLSPNEFSTITHQLLPLSSTPTYSEPPQNSSDHAPTTRPPLTRIEQIS